MVKKPSKISEAEMQVLQLLWQDSPLGASEVAGRLPESLNWTLQTVKTLLSRLVAKGALTTEQQGRRYLYRPAIEQSAIAARQAGGLVDRLFGGRVSPLVAQLAEQRKLDPQDLEELEALVRRLRK